MKASRFIFKKCEWNLNTVKSTRMMSWINFVYNTDILEISLEYQFCSTLGYPSGQEDCGRKSFCLLILNADVSQVLFVN
jgi:hypothetical protein